MKTSTRILLWAPRILCILAILFISMFAFDSFSPDRTLLQNTGAFLIHLLPSFLLLAILIVAWKWGTVGGIILTIVGIIFTIFVFNLNYNQRDSTLIQSIFIISMLCLPFVLAGILFIIGDTRKKKELSSSHS